MAATVSRPVNEEERRALRRAWRAALANGLRIVLIAGKRGTYWVTARDRAGRAWHGVGRTIPAAIEQL